MNRLIKILFNNLSSADKRKLSIVVMLTVLSSVFEIFSIGMVVPLITVLIEPDKLLEYEQLRQVVSSYNIFSGEALVLPIIILFMLITILSTVVRILSIKVSATFSFTTGSKLSVKAFKSILNRGYEQHKLVNSSEDIAKLVSKINTVIQSLIFPFVMLLGACVMFFVIAIAFMLVNFTVTMSVLLGLAIIYLGVTFYFKSRLKGNSKEIATMQNNQVQLVQESIGGIQDVILNNTYEYFIKKYKKTDMSLRFRQSSNIIVAQAPRYLIESLSVVFLLSVSYYFAFVNSVISKELILPVFVTIAMALQRILPIAQQAYRSWANIEGNKQSLIDVLELLEIDKKISFVDSSTPLTYQNTISINDLSFQYSLTDIKSLDGVSLVISKGDKIGFIGSTGSGKSTLIDVIMGLLKPSSGEIRVDSEALNPSNINSWYRLISHVPQNIYLLDGSVYQNISFGVDIDAIDKERVQLVAKLACIDEFISKKKNGYYENVGERGARLSGGQRQRLGIARALYKKTPIIILDEATSALDSKTEEKIMDNIYKLPDNPTVLIIAHRLSTLKDCNKIVELENGKIKRVGTYKEIIKE